MITTTSQTGERSPPVVRDYLSYSALNTYRSCPLRYYFRYIEQLPEKTVSSALVFGSAIHAALEFWFRERLMGHPEPDLDLLLAAYQEEWQQRNLDTVRFGKKESIDSLGNLAERVLQTFRDSDLARPEGSVLGVEEELRENVIDGCPDLLARLDLIVETDDAVVVTDFKTSRSKWSQMQAEQSGEQLLLYGELVKDLIPGKPLQLEFAVVTKTKHPTIERYSVSRDATRIAHTRAIVKQVWSGMESGLFYPSPSSMNCGGCPFLDPCRKWTG
jgi:putative RecB family exonuclease